MASAAYDIGNTFGYTELTQNYDPIYETLMSGGVVWIHLNYNNCSIAPNTVTVGADGYVRFMVTNWLIDTIGLVIFCPDDTVLVFPNGSYTPAGTPK